MKTKMRDGSGNRHYKYTFEDADRHGNVRVYFQRHKGGPKIRIIAVPGSQEFDNIYRDIFNGNQPTSSRPIISASQPGSLRWLCEQYFNSSTFKALDESTRTARRRILERLYDHWIGTQPYKFIEPRHIAKIRDERADQPEGANAIVKALRQLFAWACNPEYAHATKNPAKEVQKLASKNPDGFKAWTEADVAAFEKRHPIGTVARLALDLMLYTGVRRSDVVRLGPQMEQNGKLVFTEMKGRSKSVKRHAIPILPPLRASIDATPIGHFVYLTTKFGKPRSVKAFGNWFKRQCRLAGVDGDCSAHGLRKLGAIRAAQNGATEHQLMALYGWTNSKTAAIYTRKANRELLEGDAAAFLTGQTENEFPPLLGAVSSSGRKTPKNINKINARKH